MLTWGNTHGVAIPFEGFVEQMKDQDLNLAIGQRLRALRIGRGLTQADLGDHIGVAFQQIQKYENGTNRLAVAVLLRLCSYMEIDAGEFLKGITEAGAIDEAQDVAEALRKIPDPSVRANLVALIRSLSTGSSTYPPRPSR